MTNADQNVVSSTNNVSEKDVEAVLREKVMAQLAEHGEAFIQKALQEEIAKVKKKESDLATIRKKVQAKGRDVEDLQECAAKLADGKARLEQTCRTLQEITKRRNTQSELMAAELKEGRTTSETRVRDTIKEILQRCDATAATVAEMEEENKVLAADIDARKKKFEDNYVSFQKELLERTSSFQELLVSSQTTTREVQALEGKLLVLRRERNSLVSGKAALQEQLDAYDENFESFADSAMKPEEIASIAEKQKEQAMIRIAELEEKKAESHKIRQQLEADTIEFRAKRAALKKEVQQLEKARMASEKRCRQAQKA